MSISSKHPKYDEFYRDWLVMRDTYRGERVIKGKGLEYLPATSGMLLDGMSGNSLGQQRYDAYKLRAVYPDCVGDAVEAMIGLMHSKPPVINLPSALMPLLEKATVSGEGLVNLLRRINEQQLITGRAGLLLDLPNNPEPNNPLPYLALYQAEDIYNWDDGAVDELSIPKLNLVVLNESEYERHDVFSWTFVEKYRVLSLGALQTNENTGVYSTALFRNNTNEAFAQQVANTPFITPSIRGKTLDVVPFVFINTKDIVPTPDDPPLLGLAQLALAIYRGEADYRQNLFMQGQDTLVVIGSGEDNFRIGSGATITLPQGGDAKFIGVTATGLAEQRQSLENDKMAAAHKAGQLIDTRSRDKESGDALRIRVAAQTATLNQIAITGAAALENLLKIAATWVGANPDEVEITPSLDFTNTELSSKTLIELMTAKTMGAPLSRKSIHKLMQSKNLTDYGYDEEIEEIAEEEPFDNGYAEGSEGDSTDEKVALAKDSSKGMPKDTKQ
jgi:Domain of unknown function (DUF4055)